MKKIYFACSIRGGRADQPIYTQIVSIIKQEAEVLSELFSDDNLTAKGHTDLTDNKIWQRDLSWIKNADAVIAEITNPSLGVGYEIAFAESLSKPVLALYRSQDDRRLSAMISGNPAVKIITYQKTVELKVSLKKFISSL